MKIQQLLDHHQIARNPFAEEDAQNGEPAPNRRVDR